MGRVGAILMVGMEVTPAPTKVGVGSAVGSGEGRSVGRLTGLRVGGSTGGELGARVGCLVGRLVFVVGAADGSIVGPIVGSKKGGRAVGNLVGRLMMRLGGMPVGYIVGRRFRIEGLAVACSPSELDGSDVGSEVLSSVDEDGGAVGLGRGLGFLFLVGAAVWSSEEGREGRGGVGFGGFGGIRVGGFGGIRVGGFGGIRVGGFGGIRVGGFGGIRVGGFGGCGVGGTEQPEMYVKEGAEPAGQFVVMEYLTVPTVAPAGMPYCPANCEHGWSLRVVVLGEHEVGLSVGGLHLTSRFSFRP